MTEELLNKLDEVVDTIVNNYKLSEANTAEVIQNSIDEVSNSIPNKEVPTDDRIQSDRGSTQ